MLLLTVAIPTFGREQVLLNSLAALLELIGDSWELLVVDQTPIHEPAVEQKLQDLTRQNRLRWIRQSPPSITAAMNRALIEAHGEYVLFLDDDIVPDHALIVAHLKAQAKHQGLVAGQVLQPGEKPEALEPGERFRFNSTTITTINEFMGGNFSVRRDYALNLGGFDENFVGAAYRFEAEFAFRYKRCFGPIHFEPAASIHHLQASSGGTRAYGHHLRTVKAAHSVGAYYYWLRTRETHWWWKMLLRPLRSIRTRHHMQRPWWIPLTLIAEFRGMLQAFQLTLRGPLLLPVHRQDGSKPPENETV